jgi:hypothetical protein
MRFTYVTVACGGQERGTELGSEDEEEGPGTPDEGIAPDDGG